MNFRFLPLISCSILTWLSVACVEVKDNSAPAGDSAPPVAAPVSTPVKVAAVPVRFPHDDRPNSYQVLIQIPEGSTVVRKSADGKAETNDLSIPPEQADLTDTQVKSGENYKYVFGRYSAGQFVETQTFKVKVPLDRVIEGDLRLTNEPSPVTWPRYARVFLRKAVITTEGKDFNLEGDLLISEDATVRTFVSQQTAAVGKNGRHGGQIKFKFQETTGRLFVELRGENGGPGLPGPAHAKAADDGPPVRLGAGGVGGPVVICGGDFAPGKNGAQGSIGGIGFPGGNSGSFTLIAKNFEGLQIHKTLEPGLGGIGGEGGPRSEEVV